MRKWVGTPELVIAIVLAALVVFGIAFGTSGKAHSSTAAARAVVAQVETIATRDEVLRGLTFKHVPKPVIVTPEQTRADSLRELDRLYPPARRAADTELLELLGLVPPGTDLRKIEGDVSGQEVSGYYDTQTKRLAIVAGPALNDEVATEITLSHELNHALEDQRFGLRDVSGSGADDASTSYTALVEGTATWIMDAYARRFIPPGAALGSALSELGSASSSTAGVPPYIQRSLEFSYIAGESFVQQLYSVAHGWKLVNYALAGHPPRSTEQVMHPEKYLSDERPLPVRFGSVGTALGAGWRRINSGTIGEFDTAQMLELGVSKSVAATAAAGWGGGRYELWERFPRPKACAVPCRAGDALVLGWRWDTPLDARQFAAAARAYVTKRPAGAALVAQPRATGLALTPSRALAAKLAALAVRG